MLPIQSFKYPNGKYGVYIYKSGYQSTSAIFGSSPQHLRKKGCVDSDDGKSVLLLPIRHPVERFASGVNTVRKNKKYAGYSVNDLIEMLEQNTFRNLHFMDIATVLRNACFYFDDIHLYKFPEHYENMLHDGEYYGEIPHHNKSDKTLILTDNQKKRVSRYYAKDFELFDSIKEPGQKFYFFKI
tara:strand:+ start:389 stop:940 length:552 start_codon:yes stop_codon:yes gene_type:complete